MIRIIGAALLISGCSTFGITLGMRYKKEIRLLRSILQILQDMEWELKYRLTPLPELCGIAAHASGGRIHNVFRRLKEEIESGKYSEVSGCMNGIVETADLPVRCKCCLKDLGRSLGRYDLESQIQGIQSVKRKCRYYLEEMERQKPDRVRSFQTLAFCIGVSLVILFI